jgi:hypothetical protein
LVRAYLVGFGRRRTFGRYPFCLPRITDSGQICDGPEMFGRDLGDEP